MELPCQHKMIKRTWKTDFGVNIQCWSTFLDEWTKVRTGRQFFTGMEVLKASFSAKVVCSSFPTNFCSYFRAKPWDFKARLKKKPVGLCCDNIRFLFVDDYLSCFLNDHIRWFCTFICSEPEVKSGSPFSLEVPPNFLFAGWLEACNMVTYP